MLGWGCCMDLLRGCHDTFDLFAQLTQLQVSSIIKLHLWASNSGSCLKCYLRFWVFEVSLFWRRSRKADTDNGRQVNKIARDAYGHGIMQFQPQLSSIYVFRVLAWKDAQTSL